MLVSANVARCIGARNKPIKQQVQLGLFNEILLVNLSAQRLFKCVGKECCGQICEGETMHCTYTRPPLKPPTKRC